MTIRDALRYARDLSGLTQVQLAAALDVAQPNVAAYEAGSRKPGPDLIERWALATGTWIGTTGKEWIVIEYGKHADRGHRSEKSELSDQQKDYLIQNGYMEPD